MFYNYYERNIRRKTYQTNQVVLKASFLTLTSQLHFKHNQAPHFIGPMHNYHHNHPSPHSLTPPRLASHLNKTFQQILAPESISLATTNNPASYGKFRSVIPGPNQNRRSESYQPRGAEAEELEHSKVQGRISAARRRVGVSLDPGRSRVRDSAGTSLPRGFEEMTQLRACSRRHRSRTMYLGFFRKPEMGGRKLELLEIREMVISAFIGLIGLEPASRGFTCSLLDRLLTATTYIPKCPI